MILPYLFAFPINIPGVIGLVSAMRIPSGKDPPTVLNDIRSTLQAIAPDIRIDLEPAVDRDYDIIMCTNDPLTATVAEFVNKARCKHKLEAHSVNVGGGGKYPYDRQHLIQAAA